MKQLCRKYQALIDSSKVGVTGINEGIKTASEHHMTVVALMMSNAAENEILVNLWRRKQVFHSGWKITRILRLNVRRLLKVLSFKCFKLQKFKFFYNFYNYKFMSALTELRIWMTAGLPPGGWLQ